MWHGLTSGAPPDGPGIGASHEGKDPPLRYDADVTTTSASATGAVLL